MSDSVLVLWDDVLASYDFVDVLAGEPDVATAGAV